MKPLVILSSFFVVLVVLVDLERNSKRVGIVFAFIEGGDVDFDM